MASHLPVHLSLKGTVVPSPDFVSLMRPAPGLLRALRTVCSVNNSEEPESSKLFFLNNSHTECLYEKSQETKEQLFVLSLRPCSVT